MPPFLRLIARLTQIAHLTKNCFLTSRNPSAMNLRRLTIADFTPGLPGPTRSSLDHSINFFARFSFASCLFVSLQTQRRFLTNSAPPLIAPSNHTLRTVEPNPFKDFGFFSTVSRTQVSRTQVPKTPVPKTRFWKLLKPSHNRLKTRVHQLLSHHWLRPSLASAIIGFGHHWLRL